MYYFLFSKVDAQSFLDLTQTGISRERIRAKSYHLPLAAELIIWWGNLIKQGKKETIRNQNKKGLTANSLDSVSVFPIISTMQC
jgi:hypothetical protein